MASNELKKWAGDLARNTQDVVAVANRMEVPEPSMWDWDPAWHGLIGLWRDFWRSLPLLFLGLLILGLSVGAGLLAARRTRSVLHHRIQSRLLRNVVAGGIGVLVFLVGTYIVLRVSGLTQLALTVVGGTGLVGLAVGIAFRDITENFLASIFLSMQRPFETGDLIEVSGETGYVRQLNVRTTILMALGAGWMVGGLSKIVGGGLSAVGQPAAAAAGGATELAADALKQSGDTVTNFVDEAVSNLPADSPENNGIRAKREIGFAVARLFNPAQEGNTAANRTAAVTALVEHSGMSQADADRAVTEWTATFERLQADFAGVKKAAATKAREAADSTADALATFSLWAFVGFLIGALAATWGGYLGAQCATNCQEPTENRTFVPGQEATVTV